MFLHQAIHQLVYRAAKGSHITWAGLSGAGVYLGESLFDPLRYKRFPDSFGWEWTPRPEDHLTREWIVVTPEVR